MRKALLAGSSVALLTGIAYAQVGQQQTPTPAPERPNVTILGYVQKPGDYPYSEGQTLRALIERAGGIKKEQEPEPTYLYVMRIFDGTFRKCLASPDMPTKPWDLVTVEKEGGPTLQVFPACSEK